MRNAISRVAGDAATPTGQDRGDGRLLEDFLACEGPSAERAFRRIVERHAEAVIRACREVLRDHHRAQDAAQAVFLVLARNARSIRRADSLGPWLHGVAIRISRRARDGEDRRRKAEERARAERLRDGPQLDADAYRELHEELASLPDRYRLPIILCYFEGYTQEEAARVLGWPYGTLQARLYRGRRRLREAMARRDPALRGTFAAVLGRDDWTPSPEWASETAKAATRFAGSGMVDAVSPAAADLAAAELMLASRTQAVPAMGLLAACLAVGGLWYARSGDPIDTPSRRSAPAVAAEIAGRRVVATSPAPSDASGETLKAKAEPGVMQRTATVAKPGPSPPPAGRPAAMEHPPGVEAGHRTQVPRPFYEPAIEARPADGRELFTRVWARGDPRSHGGDGLGPVFNARSCVDCHDRGGTGGGGLATRNVDVATVGAQGEFVGGFFYSFSMNFGDDGFQYRFGYDPSASPARAPGRAASAAVHPGFLESPSVVLHRFGVDASYPAWRRSVPGRHGAVDVRISQRNPTPLFGAGLIEAIPDEAIVAAARRRSPQSRGRIARVEGGRVGRFGWKAQAATVGEFVLSAASGEMGLEVPGRRQADDPHMPAGPAPGLDLDEEECEALTRFVRELPRPLASAPEAARDSADVEEGAKAFRSIGCASCHLPTLGGVEGLYSDLLLHDMGPELSDVGGYAVFGAGPAVAAVPRGPEAAVGRDARAREWRTPPLWGLSDSGPYLHDGRAATVAQAVMLHGGQGAASADRFARLTARRRRQLEAFLSTLAAPRRPAGDVRSED